MGSSLVTLEKVLSSMPHFGILFIGLILAKILYDKTTSYKFDDELTTKDNPAFGTHLALYLLGTAIALVGTLFGSETSTEGFAIAILYSIIAIILLRFSVIVNDKFILNRFSVHDEITKKRCSGTGFVVGGSCIATGLIINGALSGDSVNFWRGFSDLIVYWFAGQVMLVIGGHVFQAITSYDVHHEIGEKNNVAAGISFCGFLVGIGIIIRAGVAGSSSKLLPELTTAVIIVAFGLVMLCLARVVADKAFLPGSPLSKEISEDQSMGAGAVAAASFVSVALVFAAAVTA